MAATLCDGLNAQFDGLGENNSSNGDGPVDHAGPQREHRHLRLLVFGPVEVVRPGKLRFHCVSTRFHHSGPAK